VFPKERTEINIVMLLPMVLNVTLSGYGLLLTNMSQELFLPRTILLAVFGKEFFPRKPVFSEFSS
jgi:hypothetical protein